MAERKSIEWNQIETVKLRVSRPVPKIYNYSLNSKKQSIARTKQPKRDPALKQTTMGPRKSDQFTPITPVAINGRLFQLELIISA